MLLHSIIDCGATKISHYFTMNNDFRAWGVKPAGLVDAAYAFFVRPPSFPESKEHHPRLQIQWRK